MVNRHFQIVMADDDFDDQYFMKEAIKGSDFSHSLTSVYDGRQLLELLWHSNKLAGPEFPYPDLIILDINMPVMNGLAALSLIKQDEKLKNIPVYILSTASEGSARAECMELGAANFFTKPSDIRALRVIVEHMFSDIMQMN